MTVLCLFSNWFILKTIYIYISVHNNNHSLYWTYIKIPNYVSRYFCEITGINTTTLMTKKLIIILLPISCIPEIYILAIFGCWKTASSHFKVAKKIFKGKYISLLNIIIFCFTLIQIVYKYDTTYQELFLYSLCLYVLL